MHRRCFCMALGSLATTSMSPRSLLASRTTAIHQQCAHALGTTVRLVVRHASAELAQRAMNAAFREVELIESVMSVYRPGSELSRLNREGYLRHPHPYLIRVLRAAAGYSKQTASAFDITVQPLWKLYKESGDHGELPSPQQLRAARAAVGHRHVEIREDRIRLAQGAQITLNGIAQGFATDCAQRVLRDHGIQDALIDVGELASLGEKANGQPWQAGIQHPREADAFVAVAPIDGRCLATSGDYATTFSDDFRSHHVFDPRTGFSPTELAAVSVLAPTAMEADALSTSLLVMGIEAGARLLSRMSGVDAMLIGKDGRISKTPGFPETQSR